MGILDSNGTIIGKYNYDAYGNIILNTVSIENHIIYKCYYYDEEIEMYYLKSRFYVSKWRSFLTPDSIDYLEYTDFNKINLYAYCGNNPVMYSDPEGKFGIFSFLVGMAIGLAITFVGSILSDLDIDGELNGDGNYAQNMFRGAIVGAVTGGFGVVAGLVCSIVFMVGDIIGSQFGNNKIKYNDTRRIEESYKKLVIKSKMDYIRDKDIENKAKINKYLLLGEWELHNILYYLDIFGFLRKHTESVDFGSEE